MTTLKQCCEGGRGEPAELPTCPGFWVVRDSERNEDVICVGERDEGELFWWSTGRPLMDFDKGEYFGPFKLVRLAPHAETEQ